MASADFYAFSAALQLWLRLSARSAQTSPGTTRFFPSIYLPHLPHAIPCSYWASTCWAALPSHIAFYAVSVRQARGLPVVSLFPHPTSFRFRLTTDTLAFSFLLPATGRIRVFHPLETCAAGRTQKSTVHQAGCLLICGLFCQDVFCEIIIRHGNAILICILDQLNHFFDVLVHVAVLRGFCNEFGFRHFLPTAFLIIELIFFAISLGSLLLQYSAWR